MRPEERHEEAGICRHVRRAADLLGKRWSSQIVLALLDGRTRFSELREAVAPISDTLLSERLKELEADGIIRRDVTPSTPVRIEYRLTDRGRDLERVMAELRAWAERWAEEPVAP
ncbi:MAG: helix-turn-helix domain-containing protein [Actinomycetota bacterium]